MWNLLSKTPATLVGDKGETEQEIPATKEDADKELSALLKERMNSSKRLPSLAVSVPSDSR